MKKIVADEDIKLQGFKCIKTSPAMPYDRQFSTFLDEEACSGCRVCEEICPSLHFDQEKKIICVNTTSCKGCGVCVSICPSNALQQPQLDDGSIIHAFNGGIKTKPFDCKFCPVSVGEGKGDIRIFCSGRVEISHILNAVLNGMNVVIIGCYYGEGKGNEVKEKVEIAQQLLEIMGIKNAIEVLSSQKELPDVVKKWSG
ncbi:MAG: hydrogenase iron-sulfur subunit [Thermoplasmata archaeon]|nr:MAG: hydrogenase iron-sulfur subunit [Thermoplasmata archaeon]